MDTAPKSTVEVTHVVMDMPTKEALCEALKKQNIEHGTEFLFHPTGTGGCDGPPCVQVREPRAPTDIDARFKQHEAQFLADTPEGQLKWNLYYRTAAVAYIEKKRIYYPTPSTIENIDFAGKPKYYYYRNYSDVDALAKTLIRVLKKQFNVKVV